MKPLKRKCQKFIKKVGKSDVFIKKSLMDMLAKFHLQQLFFFF